MKNNTSARYANLVPCVSAIALRLTLSMVVADRLEYASNIPDGNPDNPNISVTTDTIITVCLLNFLIGIKYKGVKIIAELWIV